MSTGIPPIPTPNDSRGEAPADIRRRLLSRESNIRAVGLLLLFSAVFQLLLGAGVIAMGVGDALGLLPEPETIEQSARQSSSERAIGAGIGGAALIALGVWFSWSGILLRKLMRSGRPAAYVYGILCLFGFPIGTLIGIAALTIISGRRASFILSPEYREIVAATPDIRAKLSIVTKVAIGLLVVVVFFIGALLAASVLGLL